MSAATLEKERANTKLLDEEIHRKEEAIIKQEAEVKQLNDKLNGT